MAADAPIPSLAATASLYQTKVSEVVLTGTGWDLLALADPRRYYIEFWHDFVAAAVGIVPGPGQMTTPQGYSTGSNPVAYKWRDCPSMVGGEWYAFGMIGTPIKVIECVYVGG